MHTMSFADNYVSSTLHSVLIGLGWEKMLCLFISIKTIAITNSYPIIIHGYIWLFFYNHEQSGNSFTQ